MEKTVTNTVKMYPAPLFIRALLLGLAVLFITTGGCSRLYPLLPAAPLEEETVRTLADSIRRIGRAEYGITPINSFTNPQSLKEFSREFESAAVVRELLRQAFAENRYNYEKTLAEVAGGGFETVLTWEGGAMTLLLTLPSRGRKKAEVEAVFAGPTLKNYTEVKRLLDTYLCCMVLDDF